ncbi:SigE family RNA polymerase sigma factor [Streptomyces polyrhachis]|uniref:SigE family RNA polymerase sigma factor n=1 Tax=Streptomyces polyrhachis TaxID=1282885 RepID=A0ABW2GNM2_9ACTN
MGSAQEREFLDFAAARAGHLYRSACLLTGGDTHRAEDLVQETLGRMFVTWRRIHQVGNPAGYAQTVLVRTFLSQQRRRSSTERPTGEFPDLPQSRQGDPLLRLTLLEALAGLRPKDRAVLVLRYWEDRSVAETATAMEVSENAVRTRCVRALDKLRSVLGGSLAEYAS